MTTTWNWLTIIFTLSTYQILMSSYCQNTTTKNWQAGRTCTHCIQIKYYEKTSITVFTVTLFSSIPAQQMYRDVLVFSCQTASSQWLHHRAQFSRLSVPAAAVWQVWWGESCCVCVFSFFLSALWLFVHQYRLLSPRMWWWSIFCLRGRTKTQLCRPASWKTFSACVPTCRGAPRSTWLSPPRSKATSPTSATAVSGRTCLIPLWTHSNVFVHCCRACAPHAAFHTGCLRTLTSTGAWSTWGTWDTPSWRSRSHRRLLLQVWLSVLATSLSVQWLLLHILL